MRKISLILSIIMCTALFGSCGNDDRGDGTGHMYDVPLVGNPASLDPQFADDPTSNTVIKNLYSGLMRVDESGNIVCCNAESYTVSDDGTVYNFKLREDNFWFFDENDDDVIEKEEYFPVTAEDYVFALRRVLDPQMKSPYAEEFRCIKGAEPIAKGFEPVTSAEIYAADTYSLVVVLEAPNADFLRLMSEPPTYPCNEEFFNSTKGRYGLDDRSVMSNGAFFVRQWFYDPYGNNNILYMKRNDANWSETYDIYPSFLSFTIEEDEEAVRTLFKKDDIECFTTLNKSAYNEKKYDVQGYSATTLGLIFNKNDKFYSNENMRQALASGIDREQLTDPNGDLQPASGIIPPAVRVHGRSYRELVSDKQLSKYDPTAAKESYEKAKEESGAASAPSVKILVNADTVDSGRLHILTRNWQDLFGSYIGIEDVTASEFYQRIEDGDYTIALYPLTGTQESGVSVIRMMENTPCLADSISDGGLVNRLTTCETVTELIEECTAAEKAIADSNWFIPVFYKNSYLIMSRDNEDIIYDPFTGAVDYRIALNYD